VANSETRIAMRHSRLPYPLFLNPADIPLMVS
jgi:hypothetical protein